MTVALKSFDPRVRPMNLSALSKADPNRFNADRKSHHLVSLTFKEGINDPMPLDALGEAPVPSCKETNASPAECTWGAQWTGQELLATCMRTAGQSKFSYNELYQHICCQVFWRTLTKKQCDCVIFSIEMPWRSSERHVVVALAQHNLVC